jgi:hypothetical protein
MTWRDLPPPARAVAVAACDAVAAATAKDRDAFDTAARRLAAADGSGYVLGVAVRLLLEDLHPDGLDSDDVRGVLTGCTLDAAWQPRVDPHVLLVLLTSALSVYEPDEDDGGPDAATQAWHAPLLVAHLTGTAGQPFERYLAAAFAELRRAESHD